MLKNNSKKVLIAMGSNASDDLQESLDKKNIKSFKQKNFISLLVRNNLKLNLSKTDEKIINKHEKREKLFIVVVHKGPRKNSKIELEIFNNAKYFNTSRTLQ